MILSTSRISFPYFILVTCVNLYLAEYVLADNLADLHSNTYSFVKSLNAGFDGKVDSLCFDKTIEEQIFNYLSTYIDPRIFKNNIEKKYIRVYEKDASEYNVIIIFFKMNSILNEKVRLSMTGREWNRTESLLLNSYYLYFVNDIVVMMHSYIKIDNGMIRKLRSFFYKDEAARFSCKKSDSLLLYDTIPEILTVIKKQAKMDELLTKIARIRPVNKINKLENGVTAGLNIKNGTGIYGWYVYNQNSTDCITIKMSSVIPVQIAVSQLYEYNPFVENVTSEPYYFTKQRSGCVSPVTLWVDKKQQLKMITLRGKISEKIGMCIN